MKYARAIIAIILFIAYSECKSLSIPFIDTDERSLQRAERFFEQRKYDSAVYTYDLAAQHFKAQKVWKKYITATAGKAHALIMLDAYDDAKVILDSALTTGNKLLGKSIEVANVYFVYGVLFDLMNKPQESIAMHQEALGIRKALLGPNHFQVSESYNGMGEVYRYILRDYVEAEKCFQKAIDILERSPQTHQKNLYRGYYNLATTNRLKNDFDRALGFAFNAVKILESNKPVDHTSLIRCYGIIGNIYNDQGEYGMAIMYYRKALSLRSSRKEISSETANDYSNLSQAYIEVGNFSKALQCIDSALQITTHRSTFDSAAIATIYMIKGNALREAKRYPEALQNYRLSLGIQLAFSRVNELDISDLCGHLGEALYRIGQYDSALNYNQRSIQYAVGNDQPLSDFSNPSFERLVHNPELYTKLATKGAILVKLAEKKNGIDNLKLAVECFNLSDRLMDIYWDFQESENSKIHFVERNYYIYELALNCLYQLFNLTSDEQYKQTAFQLMDKSKARSLRQAVEEAKEQARRNIPDSILSQERNIKSSIASVQNQLNSVVRDGGSGKQEKILNVELVARQKELEVWKEKLRIKFPQYAFEAKYPVPMSLEQLQTQLNNDVIFVEYFFDGEAVYAFASFEGRQHYIKMNGDHLQRNVYAFCQLLANGLQSKNFQADFTKYVALSHKLYSDLVQPIFESLGVKPKEELQQMVVIPDGVLSLLPFQALIASKPVRGDVDYKNLDYLLRHYSIAYSFDAASPFASNHTLTKKKLLAFGWSDGIERSVNDLPGTYTELGAIADIIPGKFVMGAKASKKTFLAEAPSYNILHLAIHGVGNAKDVYNNYLQFRDDKLFAHELYGYNFNSNLTVLSACETGYGKVFSAEGVYSIARGFFYAGSRSLLMTLWPINDGDNVPLIREFYRNLEQREHSSKALSASQLDYLESADEYTAHPRFWAGLVLWGSYKEIDESNKITPLYVGFVVVLLTVLTYILFRKRISNSKH